MVTDKQKELFNGKLGVILDIEHNNISEENRKKHIKWLQNVYYKYLKGTLPEEHKKDLEDNLQERNITKEEFLETKGNLDMFVELYKSKETSEEPKQETLEELEALYNEVNDSITKLEKQHTPRQKAFRHKTDEEYEEEGKQIELLKEKKKELKKKIEDLTPKKEVKEEKISDGAQKKIEELVIKNKQKDQEIIALKNELASVREERAHFSNKYREEATREFEIHKKQLEESFDKKVKAEVEEQLANEKRKELEIKQLQKNTIRKHLLKGENLSLDDIKSMLKASKIPTTKLDIALNELRVEIPGIIKQIDKDGLMQVYSIGASANDRLEALKTSNPCPRISNVFDGTVKFIIDADPHILLECTKDEMKKAREPYLQYSSANKNISIVGLGDYADTNRNMKYERWKNRDLEAMKYSYHFYEEFAKVMATAPNTNNYLLIGNHDKHPYLVGIDPIEIMNNNCNNVTFLGIDKGEFLLGNDKIGVFHGIDTVPIISHYGRKGISKQQVQQQTYEYICEEIKNIINDNIYALIAHYHIGIHNPHKNFSLVYGPLLCTAEIEDGHVKRMFVQGLNLTKKENNFVEDPYQIEIYNSNYQYIKK